MSTAWVKEYLEKKNITFTYLEHAAVYHCADSARERGVPLRHIAKALLYIAQEPVLAIVPGDLQVDEAKLGHYLKTKVRIATPEEVLKHTKCEIGVVPPFIDGIRKIVDPKVLDNPEVSFNAGIATAGIITTPDQFTKAFDHYETASVVKESALKIGLEVHVELKTATKLFCGCPTAGNEEPNTRTCDVCLGMPGSKPVLNKKAIDHATMLALALGCKINPELIFSRKSYFYPDMAKNYQISQYEIPLAVKGSLTLPDGKIIKIRRVHLEEDPASLLHPGGVAGSSYVLIDYNRSGNPLVEVVTEPDMESPEQARMFMKQLISILSYLDIFDLKKGIIKADTNISIKESGFTKVEVKNVTGFKEIERALVYEVMRQQKTMQEGGAIVQETRSWNSETGMSITLRKKETEEDYGYIIDPDLVITDLEQSYVQSLRKAMPELPQDKIKNYVKHYKIPAADAEVLAQEKNLADLFEAVSKKVDPKLAAKWLRRELIRVANYAKKELFELEISSQHLIDLLTLVETKKITDQTAQKLMEKLIEKPFDVKAYVQKQNLEAVSDAGQLEQYCKEAIKEAPQAVEDYKKGNEKALHFIVGIVMKKSKGKATPKEVNEILKTLIH